MRLRAPQAVETLRRWPGTGESDARRWEAGEVFPGGVSHEQHLRIAWELLREHGREEGTRRLVEGTRRSCEAHAVPEKFDERLTLAWANAIADAIDEPPPPVSVEEMLRRHPELARGDLLGRPDSGG